MKYVKHLPDLNWILVIPEQEDDEYLQYHGIWKLVEHEEPHESWDTTKYEIIEHLTLQKTLRMLHRSYNVIPLGAYEPDRPTIIDPSANT
jgi:hypothetical protein